MLAGCSCPGAGPAATVSRTPLDASAHGNQLSFQPPAACIRTHQPVNLAAEGAAKAILLQCQLCELIIMASIPGALDDSSSTGRCMSLRSRTSAIGPNAPRWKCPSSMRDANDAELHLTCSRLCPGTGLGGNGGAPSGMAAASSAALLLLDTKSTSCPLERAVESSCDATAAAAVIGA